jgi:hypothetical protein
LFGLAKFVATDGKKESIGLSTRTGEGGLVGH